MINLFQAMQVFMKVADAESFARAAQQLDLSTSIVTRHVANLETHLGIRLFQRTTRKVTLTEAGAQYAEGCRALLNDLGDIETLASTSSQEVSGDLRIVASGSFSLFQLAPLFAAFQANYPRIVLKVTLAERHVDLLEAGYDVGIVVEHMVRSESLVSRRLVHTSRILVAAPRYLADAGTPQSAEDLSSHRLLAPMLHRSPVWILRKDQEIRVSVNPTFSSNNALMLKQVALAGMGIALLSSALVNDDLRAGSLVRLLGDYAVLNSDVDIALVYPSRKLVPRKIRSFIDFAVAYFQ
jgi:DNA-binding transcriptional LysR family regulator